MRRSWAFGGVIVAAVLAMPASAMDRYGSVGVGSRVAVADPGAAMDRLAAASNPTPSGHGRSTKSVRNVLRDDPTLRAAFAWLDNK